MVNNYKIEVLLVSKYCSIVMQILNEHRQLSINKMLLFAYLLKSNKNYYTYIYKASTTNDVLIKAISQITGAYDDYCKNIKYIIEAIHLLIKKGEIILQEDILICSNTSFSKEKYNNGFIGKAIHESKNVSERQFLKEVINNV